MEGAKISDSLIADGCRIGNGAVIENSVIGLRCIIGENVTIRNSVIMGADNYEEGTDGEVPIGIGPGTVIDGAIVDKNVRIGSNVKVVNTNKTSEKLGGDGWVIREGIPVVLKDATLPNDFAIS